MEAIDTDVRTDDDDKLTKGPDAADEILQANGWVRVGNWEYGDTAMYADVERTDS